MKREARLRGCLLTLILTLTLIPVGCSGVPFSQTQAGQAVYARVITRTVAHRVLQQLAPAKRAELDELMFLLDLRRASGNEKSPLRIYRRIERRLANPRIVSRQSVEIVLGDMARVIAAQGHTINSINADDMEGYALVSKMMESAEGAFPSADECLLRIRSYPAAVVVARLTEGYFSDDWYHRHNMREVIVRELLSGGYGVAPLDVYAEHLRWDSPSRDPESLYGRVVRASRAELGDDFGPWFKEVRGRSYRGTMMRARL